MRRPLPLGPSDPGLLLVLLSPSSTPLVSPTLRRCDAVALGLGAGEYRVAHLFGFPVRDPRELLAAADTGVDVIGPGCDAHLVDAARRARRIVVAWGAYRAPLVRAFVAPRARAVAARLLELRLPVRLECLGVGPQGDPVHPLFIRTGARPFPWRAPADVPRPRRVEAVSPATSPAPSRPPVPTPAVPRSRTVPAAPSSPDRAQAQPPTAVTDADRDRPAQTVTQRRAPVRLPVRVTPGRHLPTAEEEHRFGLPLIPYCPPSP